MEVSPLPWVSRLSAHFLACLSLLALALTGCAGIAPVESQRLELGGGLSVSGGTGWNQIREDTSGADTLWTRDGLSLDWVEFYLGRAEGEPALERLRGRAANALVLRAHMTATEIADLYAMHLARAGFQHVQVGRIRPTPFAGAPGFDFQFRYATPGNLVFDGFAAGAMRSGKLYLIAYSGARAHQFRAHWPAVAKLLRSAKIKG